MNIIINNGNLTANNRKLQTPIETILTPGHKCTCWLRRIKRNRKLCFKTVTYFL